MTVSSRVKTAARVIAPSDIDLFRCTGCGGCCRLWGISIDDESFRRTQSFLSQTRDPRPNPDRPWFFERDGKKYYELTDAGTCVFLQADNRCYLHKHDPTLKSLVCREYPRGGIRTPRGFEMSMSFSSYGAFHQVLASPAPFSLMEADADFSLEAVAPCADRPIETPQPLSWETLFLIENILIDFLGKCETIESGLVACARFLEAVEQEGDGEGLGLKIRDRILHPAAFLECRPLSNIDAAYSMIRAILSIRAGLLVGTPSLKAALGQVMDLLDVMDRGPVEAHVGPALYYRRLRTSRFDPVRSSVEPALRKYMQYKVFQKTCFLDHGLVRGFNILCFVYAIIRLRFMLRARPSDRPMADLFEPVHFAELHFTHSQIFQKLWDRVFQSNYLTSAALGEILVRL